MDTTLRFDGGREFTVKQTAYSGSGAWQLNPQWTARVGLGVLTGGSLTSPAGGTHDFEPGGLVSVGVERSGPTGGGWAPSLDYSLSLGAIWAKTTAPGTDTRTSYSAADLRLGARASWPVAGRILGFAGVRVFGGPVNWKIGGETVQGTDIHHYQLAMGVAGQAYTLGIPNHSAVSYSRTMNLIHSNS